MSILNNLLRTQKLLKYLKVEIANLFCQLYPLLSNHSIE